MKHTFSAVSRRVAARLFAAAPRGKRPLGVECLERRDTPAGTYTGYVFQDFNADGVRDNPAPTLANDGGVGAVSLAADRGLAGVIVTAYAGTGQVGTPAVTDATGAYTLTVAAPAAAGPYRVEFTNLPAGFTDGPTGANSKTSVQFVANNAGGAAAQANVSLGATRAGDFAQDDPVLAATIYNYGNPAGTGGAGQANGGNAAAPAIVGFPVTAGSGNGSTAAQYETPTTRTFAIPYSQVGATYGLGYDPFGQNLYASAYFKRHTGFLGAGSAGTGAIYRAGLAGGSATPTAAEWANLNTIFGPGTAGANRHNPANYGTDNGNTGWAALGTTALGGLDVSDDGKYVFVMNLADRQLYRVPTSGALDNTTVQRVSVPLTNPNSTVIASNFTSDDLRPFAVQYYHGQVYVGVVYTAQTLAASGAAQYNTAYNTAYNAAIAGGQSDAAAQRAGNAAGLAAPIYASARDQLVAAVYKLDPATMQFAGGPVFTARLNYDRDQSATTYAGADPSVSPWRPWSATYFRTSDNAGRGTAPQPMLSDIAFDAAGNMTLGLRDRGADQIGNFNFSDPNNTNQQVEGFTAGDMLQAFITTPDDLSSGWTLENNARGPAPASVGTSPKDNNAGPGGGEFYSDEQLGNSHGETSMGGLLQLPGRPDVISAQMDPGTNTRAGGLSWMNTTSGREVKAFELYHTPNANNTTFSKANGLGGLTAVLDVAPIEVGNRVWVDADRDGVQDPAEAGIAGVVVQLYNPATNAVLGTATTAADGSYTFTSAAATAANPATASRRTGVAIVPGTAYNVRILNASGTGRQTPLTPYAPTVANNGGAGAGADLRDSDGTVTGTTDAFAFVAGQAGQNTHAIDFGFRPVSSVSGVVFADANNDGAVNGTDAAIGGQSITLTLTGFDVDNNPVNRTTTTTTGAYTFADLEPSDAAGYTITETTQPTGYLDGRDTAGTPYGGTGTTGAGDQITGVVVPNNGLSNAGTAYNFGEILPASLGNRVWLDANGDGQQGAVAAEPGVDGVTVVLTGTDDRGTVTPQTVTTAGGGLYGFANLRPGTYTVTFGNTAAGVTYTRTFQFTPAGTTTTDSNADRTTGAAPAVTLVPGQNDPTIDAGLYLPASLGDTVYFDADGNGTQDPGEPGLAGATVTLTGYGPDGVLGTADDTVQATVTGAAGFYQFTGLAPGTYRVVVDSSTNTTNPNPLTASDDPDAGAPDGRSVVTLGSAGSNQAQDFGYSRLVGSLGDLVWYDTNKDGVRATDGSEPGLKGFVVVATWAGVDGDLTTTGDNRTYTTTTDVNGFYQFTNLPVGNYRVTVTPPAGTNLANTYDLDSGTTNPDGTSTVTLTDASPATRTNQTVDFGLVGGAAIGDLVWYDVDGSGTQNNAEPGIAGAVVTLRGAGSDGVFNTADDLLLTTTTDGTGFYKFANLPTFAGGTPYKVTVTPPAAYPVQTFDRDGTATANTSTVTLTGNTYDQLEDFGYRGPTAQGLGNFVWLDANADGKQDATEAGVDGVTVQLLDANGQVLAVTTTGDDPNTPGVQHGYYQFVGLSVGTYSVRFGNTAGGVTYVRTYQNSPAGTATTNSDANTADGTTAPVAIGTNQFNPDVDAGLYQLTGFGDRVWFDTNGNTTQDTGEPGIVGAVVTAVYTAPDGTTTTYTQTTGANGVYNFTGLIPGTYQVTVSVPATATANGQPVGTVSPTYDITGPADGAAAAVVTSGQTPRTDVDFGYVNYPGAIGDRVWLDRNSDGVQATDGSEPGLAGVPVRVLWAGPDGVFGNGDDKLYTATTGADGAYNVTGLPVGNYRVTVDTAGTNLANTFDLDSGTTNPDGKADVTLTLTNPTTTLVDFGLVGVAKIGDLVWYDADNSGTKNNAEPGIAGAVVTLRGAGADGQFNTADDLLLSATTDANGAYLFTGLPVFAPGGTPYRVTVAAPAAYPTQTFDADGTGTANQSTVTLAPNGVDLAQDFGYRGPLTQGLGDYVWLDANGNGRQDATETGVNGVTVQLLDANGAVLAATTTANSPTTGAAGYYEFRGLLAGTYSVRFGNTAAGVTYTRTLQFSPVADGTTDSNASAATGQTGPINLPANTFDPTIDAGLYLPVSLGDRVWFDTNGDGVQNAGEPNIVGATVTVTYYGPDGVLGGGDDTVTTVTTDGNGEYVLSGLVPGVYSVAVNPATGTYNGNPATGLSPTFDYDSGTTSPDGVAARLITSGQNPRDVDFGFANFPGAIGDRVWFDRNSDGQQATDGSEPGLAGVAVTLIWAGPDGDFTTAGDNRTYSATTGADGVYNFAGLPLGNFRVTVNTAGTNLLGTYDLDSNTTNPDNTSLAVLTFGSPVRTDVDFGVVGAASVGDTVWYDVNGNGTQDNAEPGIAGLTVTLTGAGADGVLDTADDLTLTTTTGATGGYSFPGLPVFGAGTPYRVTLPTPAAYPTPTFDADGTATPNTSTVTLAPNGSNPDQDFGVRGPLTQGLGNFVWLDANGNGRQDANEAGVNGVTVQLLDANGNVLAATTTAAAPGTGAPGYYEFRGLAVGTYSVRFGNTAAGVTYTRTQQDSPVAADDADSDANTTDGTTAPVAIGAGVFDPTIDAGLYLPVSLGDTVWFDANRSGVKDVNEPGLANVRVVLEYAGPDGVFGTADDAAAGVATTDAAGNYSFTNLRPGAYRVTVDTSTLPNGITAQTFDRDGLGTPHSDTAAVNSPAAPQAGLTDPNFDFGYVGTATLGDTVWYDFDRSGVQNNNEPGIANVVVTLTWAGPDGQFGTADDFAFAPQTTDAQGKYLFTGLPAGNYRATVTASTVPAGVPVNTFDLDSGTTGADGTAATTLAAGQDRRDVDFGYAGTGSIGDTVYADTNGNGVQDPGEGGIPNTPVRLTWAGPDGQFGTADDVAVTTVTGPGGQYTFTGLPPGAYTVAVTTPAGSAQTGDPDGTRDGSTGVTLTPGQNVPTADFGYQGTSTLAGSVYVDSNADGARGPSENGIPGVVLTLTGTDIYGNPVTATATTGADGRYLFPNLQPGTYTVTETQPGQYGDGLDRAGTVGGVPTGAAGNDVVGGVVVGPFQAGVGYDFGEVGGTIAGVVFIDRDRDGNRGPSEPGTPGVTVTLTGPNGIVLVGTTGPDGSYTFTDLPTGTYTVTETQPAGTGNPAAGPFAPDSRPVGLAPGGSVAGQNFGDTYGTVSGTVYSDANADGVRTPGEPGLPGVTVVLIDAATGAVVATTTTDAAGNYLFGDLPAGTYAVAEVQPAGYLDGADTAGPRGGTPTGADAIVGVPVAAGADSPANNFGEFVPATVTGTVYTDVNRDGTRTPNEPGIPGVTVQLLDPAGNVLATTTTDGNGDYRFPGVRPGVVIVRELQPGKFGSTANTGGDDRVVTVTPGATAAAAAFPDTLGTIAGTVYLDDDQSTTRTPGTDPGIAGITVTLLDAAGNVVATTTTDGNGNYRFTGLPAGDYTVVETQPPLPTTLTDGYYDGFDTAGNFGGTAPAKNSTRLTLPAGADATGYDFGELAPADPFGYVFVDLNKNGTRDPGEPGIANVAVTVSGTAFAGTPFARRIVAGDIPGGLVLRTDADGRYSFAPVPPGVYTITETQPAGYADGADQSLDRVGPFTERVGNDRFRNIVTPPRFIRGPFNFGETLNPVVSTLEPVDFFPPVRTTAAVTGRLDPTKRNFLGSTDMAPLAAAATAAANPGAGQATAPTFGRLSLAPSTLIVGEDVGGGLVRVFDYQAGVERFRFRPFPDFTGGVHVAAADVNGDGIPDIITTPGVGGGPIVRVFDGLSGEVIANVMAFEESFRGGLQLAVGDTNGDGYADIVVAPDQGGGPIVRAFDGKTFTQTANFFALDPNFRGGLRLATGDLNADGRADLVVTAGVGGGPRVAGYDGTTLGLTEPTKLFGDFFAFAPELRSGFYASVGDVDGDGFGDVVLGAGPGGGPRVAAYGGRSLTTNAGPKALADLFAGDESSRAGVRVKAQDIDGDGKAEIVAVPGAGARPVATVVDPLTGQTRDEFLLFPTDFLGGVTVG